MNIIIKKLLKKPLLIIINLIGKNHPEIIVRFRYFLRFHRFLNLKNPQTLNEKILYLSLRTDTKEWTKLTDKYRVRDYVKKCGLEKNLVKLYAHWTKEEDINFNCLPNNFVIKSVGGCGDVILVKNKELIDEKNLRKKLKVMLKKTLDATSGEKHYFGIKPAIIVEELLPNDDKNSSLTDYKFWCFNGKPKFVLACSNRFNGGVHLGSYDIEWNYRPKDSIFSKKHPAEKQPLPKPENLDDMIMVAEKLSKPFACVRVDLYNIHGKVYFGEMTFTSLGGMMNYYTDDFQYLTGNMIDLNYKG